MSEKYRHTPLQNPRSIRLLRLKPRPPLSKSDARSEYELVEALLDNVPAYSAVSYAWDAQIPTCSISCAGSPLPITANCAAALTQLARKEPARLLWVDSVCIDQGKMTERNEQVSLMAEIYSKAERVLIWLGEGNEESAIAMKTLRDFGRLGKYFPSVVKWKFKRLQASRRSKFMKPIERRGIPLGVLLPNTYLSNIHPMNEITERSWFERIWTLQEIVMAKNAVLLCGSRSISWDRLAFVSDMITESDASTGFTEYPGDALQRVRIVCALRSLLGIGPPKVNLSYKLPKEHPFGSMKVKLPPIDTLPTAGIATHYFLATMLSCGKPQDKVYGLYAILQGYDVKLLPPDYNKPVSTILVETARTIIERDSSLELLYYVSCQSPATELPSWVPDATDPMFAWVPGFEYTCASKQSAPRFRFNSDECLSVFGFDIDTIQATSNELGFAEVLDFYNMEDARLFLQSYKYVVHDLQGWVRFALGQAPVAEDAIEAFCMVTLQEIALAFCKDPKDWAKVLAYFTTWTQALATEESEGEEEEEEEEEEEDEGEEEEDNDLPFLSSSSDLTADKAIYEKIGRHPATTMIHHAIIDRGDKNRLFRTASGHLGIATEMIMEGDRLVLVSGLRLPMILRRMDSGLYKAIGSCYLHGVMQGELWPEQQGNIQEFALR